MSHAYGLWYGHGRMWSSGVRTVPRVIPRMTLTTFAAVGALGLSGLAATSVASAARTTQVREHVSLKLVKRSGSTFTHSGTVTGTIPGSARSTMRLDGLTLSGTVKIRARGGETLNLKIRGTARSAGLRSRFGGTATIDGGSGKYAHARGRGRFSGVVNRSTWAATIDANGSLTY